MSKGIAFQTSQATSASQVGIRIGKGEICVSLKSSHLAAPCGHCRGRSPALGRGNVSRAKGRVLLLQNSI